MHPRDWTVCMIEPNKLDSQIIADVLRNAGVHKLKTFADGEEALIALGYYNANVIIGALEMAPVEGVAWTKTLRRRSDIVARKAAIFLTSKSFSRAIAEECRIAGANALIGKPVSGAAIIATIKKVLENPRPWIEGEVYVGPCRRAGIVTAGAGSRRRRSDNVPSETPIMAAAAQLAKQVDKVIKSEAPPSSCAAALASVQAIAMRDGDGPLMRVCAAFTLQLSQDGEMTNTRQTLLAVCMAGVTHLAAIDPAKAEKRDALAEEVRRAVARAASAKAA